MGATMAKVEIPQDVLTSARLKIVGVIGVLLEGKKAGRFPRLEPILGRLRREAGFYFCRDLETRALALAGELTASGA